MALKTIFLSFRNFDILERVYLTFEQIFIGLFKGNALLTLQRLGFFEHV